MHMFIWTYEWYLYCRCNVRDVFELYKREYDPGRIEHLLQRGFDDLHAFCQFEKLDKNSMTILMSSAIGRNTRLER